VQSREEPVGFVFLATESSFGTHIETDPDPDEGNYQAATDQVAG
jgi:hypothetical protein